MSHKLCHKNAEKKDEDKRLEKLLQLWRKTVDFRSHIAFHKPTEEKFDEIETAEKKIDEDIEDVFQLIDEYETEYTGKVPEEERMRMRKHEKNLLRAAIKEELKKMREDPDSFQPEIIKLDAAFAFHHDYNTVLDFTIDIGERCRICRRTWPASNMEQMCSCTEALAHRQCLEERLRFLCLTACELCGRQYHLEWLPHYSPLRGLWAWIMAHASKVELLLAVFLAALVVTKAVLLSQFILHSTITGPESPRGNHTDIREMVSELWTVSKQHWKHMVLLTHLPCWFLPLAILVFLMHAGLAVIVSVSNIMSFRTWYCRTARVTILGGDQPSSGDHEPAK